MTGSSMLSDNKMADKKLADEMLALGRRAKVAARALREASGETKNKALRSAAVAIRARKDDILAANAKDMQASDDLSPARAIRARGGCQCQTGFGAWLHRRLFAIG